MVSGHTLEERIVFLTRLWRNFANFEYASLLDEYDCMDKAGNLLARMLPHACEFADRLARMDYFKSMAERQATDDGALHCVLAEMMIPEEVCGYVIQWITRKDEEKVRRAIRAHARERKLADGHHWRMDRLGIRLSDIAKEAERLPDEVFAIEDTQASRENIILVTLFFLADRLGLKQVSYDCDAPNFDPEETGHLVRRLVAGADIVALDTAINEPLRPTSRGVPDHVSMLGYPRDYIRKAYRDGDLGSVFQTASDRASLSKPEGALIHTDRPN